MASGGYVIGLSAGSHCGPDHGARLNAIGVDALFGRLQKTLTPRGLLTP